MKILVVHNRYYERGGEDGVVENEMELLRKHGHDVFLYERSNREIENFSFSQKCKLLLKDTMWSQRTYTEVRELIQKIRPDIVHTHNIFVLISPSVYDACRDAGVPVVQTLHNYRFFCPKATFFRNKKLCMDCFKKGYLPAVIHRCWKNSFFVTWTLARLLKAHFKKRTFQDKIDAFIVLSDFGKGIFVKGGIPAGKIYIKPNFIDVKEDERESYEDFAVFAGRLVDYKGVFTLVEAFKKIPEHKLIIIGDGPAYKEIKENIASVSNIEVLGRLSYEDTINYLKKASFLIFPSEWYEGLPLTVIESLAYGVPVLISNIAFPGSGIQKNGAGLEFESGNSWDMAEKIRFLMANKEILARMSKAGRELYTANYTPERNYAMLIQIYNHFIANSVKT